MLAHPREKTVDAVRWAIVVLAVFAAWECARSLNMVLHTQGLVRAGDFLRTAQYVVYGSSDMESEPGILARAGQLVAEHVHIFVGGLFLLAVASLVTRMLFASPLLDFLYLESEASDRRTMVGFLVATFGLLAQMGLIYGMVIFARSGDGPPRSGMVPLLMVVYLLGGALWMLLMRLGAKPEDRRALRGFWPALLVNVLVGVGLGALLWYLTGDGPGATQEFHHDYAARNIAITAVAALLLCSLDTFFQGQLYGKTTGRSRTRSILMGLLLLILLGFGAYVISLVVK
jgi:hypothetical protein